MKALSLKTAAVLMMLMLLFHLVTPTVSAATDTDTESNPYVDTTPTEPGEVVGGIVGVIGGVNTVFTCIEYVGKTVSTITAIADAAEEGKTFWEVFEIGINTFIGRDKSSAPGTDLDAKAEFDAVRADIAKINGRLDNLESELEEINASLDNVYNTIITEGYKSYINDFRMSYRDMSDSMIEEYDQLIITLADAGTDIDEAKLAYDDLYINASRLNKMLIGYMSGIYREDGMSIQEVMHAYAEGAELNDPNEFCTKFASELFGTFALSQYCLLICRMYQLNYCDHHGITQYVTENADPEALPHERIVSALAEMDASQEFVAATLGGFVMKVLSPDLHASYVSGTEGTDRYSVRYSETGGIAYPGDVFTVVSPFPTEFLYFFGGQMPTIISDSAVATVDGSVATVAHDSGIFNISVSYRSTAMYSYAFEVGGGSFAGGYGTANAPYLISSASHITAMGRCPENTFFKLISDVDCTATTVSGYAMRTLSGAFDGNGHTIKGLTITGSDAALGFFGTVTGSVRDLTLSSVKINVSGVQSRFYAGFIAGENRGTILNCITDNCRAEAVNHSTSAPYESYIGSVAGYSNGTIVSCTVKGTYLNMQRLAVHCYSSAAVRQYIGGLAGFASIAQNNLVDGFSGSVNMEISSDYRSGSPQIQLGINATVGNRSTSAAEAITTTALNINTNANHIIYYPTGTNSVQNLRFASYSSIPLSSIPAEDYGAYRLIESNGRISLDPAPCQRIYLHSAPIITEYLYGEPINLAGVEIYANYKYFTAPVSVRSVSDYDPCKIGEQIITLEYSSPYGESLTCNLKIKVVCLHDYEITEIITPQTHLADGFARFTCAICGTTAEGKLDKLAEHSYSIQDKNENEHTGSCECGSTFTEAHRWNEGEVITPEGNPDVTAVLYTCTDCGRLKTEILPPEDGHRMCEWVVQKAATCSASGVKYRYCLDIGCGYTESEIIPILAHIPSEWIVDKEPTCTEKGRMHTECTSGCGGTIDVSDIPLAKHMTGEYVSNGDATYTEDGTKSATCTVCGAIDTVTDEGSALGLAARFCDEVAAIPDDAPLDVLYGALRRASATYASLTDAECEAVSAEADVLRAQIARYNERAESLNGELRQATEVAFLPIAGGALLFLAALLALLKLKLII